MSDYKILHKRIRSKDLWEVYYEGAPLSFYTFEVLDDCGRCAANPYNTLDDAKKIIKSHKSHIDWIERNKKEDIVEWLDEEGNKMSKPFPRPKQISSCGDNRTLWQKFFGGS